MDELPISDPQYRPSPQVVQQQQRERELHNVQQQLKTRGTAPGDASMGAGRRHLDPVNSNSNKPPPPTVTTQQHAGKPMEPSQFNLGKILPRHIPTFSIGTRIVREVGDGFDSSTEALVKCFHPIPLPKGFCCGCLLLDRFTGHHAVVCGCLRLREKPLVLYMHLDGHRGATPFVTDGAFLHRWRVLEKESLPLGSTFIVPNFSAMPNIVQGLVFTGLVAPIPVDVSQLNAVGLETGMTLIGGKGQRMTILGLCFAPESDTELTLLCRTQLGDPYFARRGEIFTVVAYRFVRTLRGSVSQYRAVDIVEQDERLDLPLMESSLFRLDALTFAAFDVNPDRCMAYFGLRPGEVLNQQKVVIGLRYGPPIQGNFNTEVSLASAPSVSSGFTPERQTTTSSSGTTTSASSYGRIRSVRLYAMKIDSSVAEVVHPGATVMVTGAHAPPTSAAPPRISLMRPHPTSEPQAFTVPKLPQLPLGDDEEKSESKGTPTPTAAPGAVECQYDFCFPYPHATRRIVYLDPKAMEEKLDLHAGQRLMLEDEAKDSTGQVQFMTAMGLAQNPDTGEVSLMVEVDGAMGVVDVDPGVQLQVFQDRVQVAPFRGRTILYRWAEARADIKITPTKFFPLGPQAWVEGVDADPVRCRMMFGLVPGQRLSGCFTVVGMQQMDDQVHLLFHEDGCSGAIIFDDVMSFFTADPPEMIEPHWVTGRTLKYRPLAMDYSIPWTATVAYKFGSELSTVELIDADPARCRRYYGIVPGQRLGGRITFLGLALQDDEVYIVGHKEGDKVARSFNEPCDIFVFEDLLPIQLPQEDPKSVHVVVYNPARLDSRFPLWPDFPCYIGPGDSPVIGLIDANKAKCRHYFGITPGTRVNGVATCAGMMQDEDTGLVVLLFFIDGAKGAGSFDPGARLEVDGEVRQLLPLELNVPIPTGSYSEVVLPPLPQYAEAYMFTFPAVTPSGTKVLLDVHFLPRQYGIHHGQRCRVGQEYCALAGVGVGPQGATYFFKKDEGSGCAIAPPGTTVRLYNMVVTIPPFLSRTVCYFDKPVTNQLPQVLHSVPVKVSLASEDSDEAKTTEIALDTDPRRCYLYFGIVPGQRADGRLICVGMAVVGKVVKLFFRPERDEGNGTGAFTISNNTDIELEQLDPQNLAQLEAEAAAYRERDRDKAVGYQPASDRTAVQKRIMSDAVHLLFDESAAFPHHTPTQAEGLRRVTKAAKESDSTDNVLSKLRRCGYSNPQQVLEQMLAFVSNEAPIVSWFKPFKLISGKPTIELMTEDIAMRTLFEVGAGNACEHQRARKSWETRIFRGAYDNCEPFERVKYGVINVWNDPYGPRTPGDQYGDCFMVFAGLRDLISLTPKDSSDSKCRVATLTKGLVNILDEFQEDSDEFENLTKLATGKVASATSVDTYYKEIQIHASVFFEQHISHVVIAPHYAERPADLHLLLNFCRKNGCWLVTNKTLRDLAAMRLWDDDHLATFLAEHNVRQGLTQMYGKPKLLAGPQTELGRALYDVICDYVCMSEMDELRQIAEKATFADWKPQVDLLGA